ncbi:monovalent cation/H+ antiporter subunit D family protein [Brachybacterium sp. EF45031]|uniref:proton-conducting transporter transmembrane domain-containing protein n=1 Tax=Brachybacterium sillae TaxID=2810536 RepID=UPI00217EAF64|nr:proton-conducting transporter membrane subunit [Brachybacterium sillae]MCS6711945.1 monovalent cation/H+ antiporter subunit D family protein [Brachybacterium sillae]
MPAQLLTLWVAVPLLSAGLLVAVRARPLHRTLMLALPLVQILGSVLLLRTTVTTGALSNVVGGYEGFVGIPFVADTLTGVMLLVTALATFAACAFLALTGEDRRRFTAPLVLMLTTGVNGALLTGDLFNLFVWVEVMLMPSYALLALTGTWRRLGLGRVFVLVNLMTSAVLVFGVGMVYATAGSVNLAVLAGAAAEDPRTAGALTLVLLALLVKGGLFPVHSWLPRAYPATSAGVMALFSALHTKVALYAVYRVMAVTGEGTGMPLKELFVVLVIATMLVGAFATAVARDLRTILAHQMVAGVGHILLGAVLATEAAVAAGLLYMVHHIVTMGALILVAGAIEYGWGTGSLARLGGLARREPWTMGMLALGLFSLAGLPPTSGLWGKVGLMIAAADATGEQPVLAGLVLAAIVLASVVSLLGLQRLWSQVAWGEEPPGMLDETPAEDGSIALGATTGQTEADRATDEQRAWAIPAPMLLPGLLLLLTSLAMFLLIGQILPWIDAATADLADVESYRKAVLGR